VVYASVEYEDLANVCDRVLVFHRGSMVNTLSGSSLTADRIAEYCYRSREAA
jgi:ribose transport system ATP-binding protein